MYGKRFMAKVNIIESDGNIKLSECADSLNNLSYIIFSGHI